MGITQKSFERKISDLTFKSDTMHDDIGKLKYLRELTDRAFKDVAEFGKNMT